MKRPLVFSQVGNEDLFPLFYRFAVEIQILNAEED